MPSFLNFKGYTKSDPLDKAPPVMQYIPMMTVTFIVSVVLIYLITDVFKLFEFRSFGVKVLEVSVFTIIAVPVITALRKSGSPVLILLIFIPLFIFDIYLQGKRP